MGVKLREALCDDVNIYGGWNLERSSDEKRGKKDNNTMKGGS
jgi:hypothetical protein